MIEYGRNQLAEVQNFIEEFAPHGDITQIDIKIKRIGKGKETEYRWMPVMGTERELDADELALEVPDMEDLMPVKEELELEKRAADFERHQEASAKKAGVDEEDPDDNPIIGRRGGTTTDEDELDEVIPF
jgi:hypothetical protein